jgi:triosephosphate isomerase
MELSSNQFLVIANMKMNVVQEKYLNEYKNLILNSDYYKVVILPPSPFIVTLHNIISNKYINHIGVQNIHAESKGSFTGATSIDMVLNYISYVLIGHSERRILFSENNLDIRKQLVLTINKNLIPILAVGESAEDKNRNQFESAIRVQLSILKDIKSSEKIYVAYEPVWAIGTDNVADSQYIADAAAYILEEINRINSNINISVIYGGSVTDKNITEIYNVANIDGVLVGGASADVTKFAQILHNIDQSNSSDAK